jgi:hypothetical protein
VIKVLGVLVFLAPAGALSALLAIEGLDRTEKWFSIAGVLIPVALAGLIWVRNRSRATMDTGVVTGAGSVVVGENAGEITTSITASSETAAPAQVGGSGTSIGPGAVMVHGLNHQSGVIRTSIERDPGASG